MKRAAPAIFLILVAVPWLVGGCASFSSWFTKDDSSPHQAQENHRPAPEAEPPTAENGPQVLESDQSVAEKGQKEAETGSEDEAEPAVQLSQEERTLEERVHEQKISQASDEIHQIQRIGDDLSLKLFLDRLNANLGRITFSDIVKKWGLPQELVDGGTVVLATWRWLTSPATVLPNEPDTQVDQSVEHGEQVTLSFEKSGQVLVNWQYGRW